MPRVRSFASKRREPSPQLLPKGFLRLCRLGATGGWCSREASNVALRLWRSELTGRRGLGILQPDSSARHRDEAT